MAIAAKKKTAHKSFVANPPKSRFVSNGKKRPTSKRRKKNPASGGLMKVTRRRARRNPSPQTNAALAAIGGAFALILFNEGVNRFFPSVSTTVRVGAKVGLGWAVGNYGTKYIGGWARIAQGALWMFAAYEGFDAWVRPHLAGYLTPATAPAVTGQVQVKNPQTGQDGTRYMLNDGNSFDIYQSDPSQSPAQQAYVY
jgi:hypothetical protein